MLTYCGSERGRGTAAHSVHLKIQRTRTNIPIEKRATVFHFSINLVMNDRFDIDRFDVVRRATI